MFSADATEALRATRGARTSNMVALRSIARFALAAVWARVAAAQDACTGDGVAVVRCQLNAGHNFDVRPWARVLIHDFTLAHPKPAAAASARAAAAQVRATHWKPARSVRPLTPAEER